jgi:hypothetical protein
MALHLVPDDGDGPEHVLSRDCPCRPELVDVECDDGSTRRAVQHHGATDSAEAIET